MIPHFVNKLYIGISLLVLFDAFLPQMITLGGRVFIDHFRMVINILCLVLFLISAVILVFNFRKFKESASGNHRYFILLFIWIFLSHFWSNNIYATFEGSMLLTFTLIFVIFSFVVLEIEEFWNVLFNISVIITIFSIISIIVLPEISIMPEGLHHGDWRGVFLHKNALGNYMAIINIIFLVSFRKNYRSIFSIVGYVLSWILILGSGSKTSIASTVFVHIIMTFLLVVKNKKLSFKLMLWIISVPVLLIIFLIFFYYEKIAVSLGESATLTGRIPLWYGVFQAIADEPVLGYGYAAFWGSEYGSLKFLSDSEWISGKSHNAFMDIWLDLGIVGLVFFIGFLGTTFSKLLYLYRKKGDLYSEAFLLIMILIISVSMLDFRILYYNSIVFFFVVYIYFYTNSVNSRKKVAWKLVKIKGY